MRANVIFSDSTLMNAAFAEVCPEAYPTVIQISPIVVRKIVVTDEMGFERIYGRTGRDAAWAVDMLLENSQQVPMAVGTDEGDIRRFAEWVQQHFDVPIVTIQAGRA